MKNTRLIILAILSLTLNSCGQTKTDDIQLKESGMINITGTKVFVPKSSFAQSENLPKLSNDNNAILLVTELPNDNFENQAKNLPPPNIERSGAEIIDIESFKIDKYPAKKITIKSSAEEKILMLLFGDDTFCTMVTSIHKWNDKETEEEIKYILENIAYKENLTIDPLSTSPFIIVEAYQNFKHYSKSQNTHIYTRDGKERTNVDKDPSLAIIYGTLNDHDEFEEYFKKTTNIKSVKEYEIYRKDQEGYEGSFELENGNQGYYLLLRKNLNYILVRGTAMENHESTLKEFKNFASQIKWK